MSLLVITPDDAPGTVVLRTTDPAEIATALSAVGVVFEQWGSRGLAPDAGQDDVLTAYADEVARIRQEGGYDTVDVIRLRRGPLQTDDEWATQVAGARSRFLAEHTHADDEVRFFVEGSGAFYLRLDGRVHIVVGQAGDYLSVPAGTRHWFDMGADPGFAAIRFFKVPEGWVGDFTGDPIAAGFPTYDELVVPAA